MKKLLFIAITLGGTMARGQTTTFDQIQRLHTALNHLTVIDLGEPVTDLAIGDRDAFQVERHENRVFLMPLRDGSSTNLFIWTATRQIDYEIDSAGDLTKMDVMVRNASPSPVNHAAPDSLSDIEIKKITTLALTDALFAQEEIQTDGKIIAGDEVSVQLKQVIRTRDQIYIRYTIANTSQSPFRVTPPDAYQPTPTQLPISLVSLRNHQLSDQTYAKFKAKSGPLVPLVGSQVEMTDLAPGQRTIGLLSIRVSASNPARLYRLQFGAVGTKPIAVDVVL